jgi:hypothetical protein
MYGGTAFGFMGGSIPMNDDFLHSVERNNSVVRISMMIIDTLKTIVTAYISLTHKKK